MASRLKNIQSPSQITLTAFKKEITKLQSQNAKLEAEKFKLKARLKVLEAERKMHEPPTPTGRIEIARRIAFTLASAGIHLVGPDGKRI